MLEDVSIELMMVVRRLRGVDRDVVTRFNQFIEWFVGDLHRAFLRVRQAVWLVVLDVHAQTVCLPSNVAPDVPKANDTQSLAGNFVAQEVQWCPSREPSWRIF